MPYIPNGNIYAPLMMSAEKAADLIFGDEPLAAATEMRSYRYRRNTPLYPPGDPRNGRIRHNDEVS